MRYNKTLKMTKTAWEKIYVRYQETGKKWASLADPIHPSFLSFVKRGKFDMRSALDLGCGNGKHLKFLQDIGFRVAGIDSSPTGIKLARKKIGKKADLRVRNIYESPIPSGRYDFIFSIATLQHARKGANKKLIGKIYAALPAGGKIFITFPRTSSVRRWETFKGAKMIAPGTYIPFVGPEKGLPHSFYGKGELTKLFSRFRKVKIGEDDRGRWIVRGEK
jgi:SAM-dependent methyltransferase